MNLNRSVGHEIRTEIPIRAAEKQLGRRTQVDSRTRSSLWKTEICDRPPKSLRAGTLRSDQRARAHARRILRWCHFEFGIKLMTRINAEMFFWQVDPRAICFHGAGLDYGADAGARAPPPPSLPPTHPLRAFCAPLRVGAFSH